MPNDAIDVHQHLWPDELVDRLRARTRPPYLRDWTLHTDGEPPYVVDPSAHDPQARVAADRDAGVGVACVSLSAPLGIEALPRRDAAPLIKAWHRGAVELPQHFRAWASVPATDPDLEGLRGRYPRRRAGAFSCRPPAVDAREPADDPGARGGRGRRRSGARPPGTGPAHAGRPRRAGLVAGSGRLHAQLTAAWWAWHAVPGTHAVPVCGSSSRPRPALPRCTTSRHALRGGTEQPVDPGLVGGPPRGPW